MSPMICMLSVSEVFCLEEECSLEGVENEVVCSPDCLFIGGGVDGVLDGVGSDEVALRRLLLCRADIF